MIIKDQLKGTKAFWGGFAPVVKGHLRELFLQKSKGSKGRQLVFRCYVHTRTHTRTHSTTEVYQAFLLELLVVDGRPVS